VIRIGVRLAALLICAGAAMTSARAETPLERGKYLATIMDCGGCHTTGSLVGHPDPAKYLAGSDIGWLIPNLGVFYPANITPDKATGIGAWGDEDIVKALRTGVRPDGRDLAPMMPWRAYAALSAGDMEALVAFLRSVPAVEHAVAGPTGLDAVKTPYITVAVPAK
jgi:mono/diheme cytochrome c family protein